MTDINSDIENQIAFQPRRKARATNSIVDKDRRAFLRLAMAQGVAAPAALQSPALAEQANRRLHPAHSRRKGAMRHTAADRAELHAAGAIVRDFVDPQLELIRLLREAAEIEHALMLQYLFCAFSLRENYSDLAGHGSMTADNVLGVAIQEMHHLAAVNRLLVKLGSCPHLDRQDFPYEPDIYPFAFNLEPMSRSCLAKFVYCEAPADVFDSTVGRGAADQAFRQRVFAEFGGKERLNHVGSLYRCVLDMLAEVSKAKDAPITPDDGTEWHEKLVKIMEEGEHDHYMFFRSVFEAKHEAFAAAGVDDVWDLNHDHPAFPAHRLELNPTAFIGHPKQIQSAPALVLAWLGNLHYWVALSSLDYGYRAGDEDAIHLAMEQMMLTIWPIAGEMPKLGAGMPFDPLSMGYALGSGPRQSKRLIASFGREAQAFARAIEHRLPSTYNSGAIDDLIAYMSA